jgi:L-alanine-DL-glutamate epimerase-like enolase superfamily enzyme
MAINHHDVAIDRMAVSAYSIPTDAPEADGTYEWKKTILVLVRIAAGDAQGLGYAYADMATAHLIHDQLHAVVVGCDPLTGPSIWTAMNKHIRNLGRPGIASMAISAVDTALWDLKAKLLDIPLFQLLGAARLAAPIYGSGGFTSYSTQQLREQLSGWVRQGIPRVKMKIGSNPEKDLDRVQAARSAIGDNVELFVDANGAYSQKQALAFASQFADLGVSWFEEPVSSDDLAGLHLIRNRAPSGMDIAAGEYGYEPLYFRRMLESGAVDVLQADATRCGGITGFLKAADLCEAFGLPFSAHCAPPSTCIPAVRRPRIFGTSNTFTITPESKRCCSMAP